MKLWDSPVGGKLGVSLVPCLQTSDTVNPVPMYSDFVYGFQVLTKEELALYNKPEWRSANIVILLLHRESQLKFIFKS